MALSRGFGKKVSSLQIIVTPADRGRCPWGIGVSVCLDSLCRGKWRLIFRVRCQAASLNAPASVATLPQIDGHRCSFGLPHAVLPQPAIHFTSHLVPSRALLCLLFTVSGPLSPGPQGEASRPDDTVFGRNTLLSSPLPHFRSAMAGEPSEPVFDTFPHRSTLPLPFEVPYDSTIPAPPTIPLLQRTPHEKRNTASGCPRQNRLARGLPRFMPLKDTVL